MSRYHDQFSKQPPSVERFVLRLRRGADELEYVVRTRSEAEVLAERMRGRGWTVVIHCLHVGPGMSDDPPDVAIGSVFRLPDD